MNIGNYLLRADSLQYIVAKPTKTGKGAGTSEQALGYFTSLPGALKFIVEQGVRETEFRDIAEVSQRIEEIKAQINKALGVIASTPDVLESLRRTAEIISRPVPSPSTQESDDTAERPAKKTPRVVTEKRAQLALG